MQNQERNKLFLNLVDKDTRNEIVNSIATHYGTDAESIIEELTDNDEAEHLLEYMTEPQRTATSALMLRHNVRGF
jgi:phosphohistidine phosphatase SixA